MNLTKSLTGEATITSGVMLIVDPCYVSSESAITPDGYNTAQKHLDNKSHVEASGGVLIKTAANGAFEPEIDTEANGRVSKVTFNFVGHTARGKQVSLGQNGVDSGQMFFVDAQYLIANPLDYEALHEAWCENGWDAKAFSYHQGLISGTGYGDGLYEVEGVVNSDGLVEEVSIIFISEPCEECGEEKDIYSDGYCRDCYMADEEYDDDDDEDEDWD